MYLQCKTRVSLVLYKSYIVKISLKKKIGEAEEEQLDTVCGYVNVN